MLVVPPTYALYRVDPSGAVELDIDGIAKENTLPRTGRHRPGSDLLAMLFPHRARKEQQAALWMLGQRDATFALKCQGVTMLGWNGHPPFCIEVDR